GKLEQCVLCLIGVRIARGEHDLAPYIGAHRLQQGAAHRLARGEMLGIQGRSTGDDGDGENTRELVEASTHACGEVAHRLTRGVCDHDRIRGLALVVLHPLRPGRSCFEHHHRVVALRFLSHELPSFGMRRTPHGFGRVKIPEKPEASPLSSYDGGALTSPPELGTLSRLLLGRQSYSNRTHRLFGPIRRCVLCVKGARFSVPAGRSASTHTVPQKRTVEAPEIFP